jgi:hypothetical protein
LKKWCHEEEEVVELADPSLLGWQKEEEQE